MDIKDRIKALIEKERLPPKVFAETIGIQQSTLSHILNGRNKPSLEVIMKIHQKYTRVRLEWLLDGKGEMTDGEAAPAGGDLYTIPFDEESADDEGEKATLAHEPFQTASVGNAERPKRRICEIRVFYDDNTYEIFRPG